MTEPEPYSVEWTVERMIATYPSLFQSRTHALAHLFMVRGCGYRWKSGKLVSNHATAILADRIPRSAAKILAQHRMPLDRPYTCDSGCNLAKMPADADTDWKEAAAEIRSALRI